MISIVATSGSNFWWYS